LILDTNVLLYALGGDHPLRAPAQRIVQVLRSGEATATTSVLVIQEFTYAFARRRGNADAVAYARAFVLLLEPLVSLDQAHLATALDLVASIGLRPTDALIAASALHASETLVSADRAFSSVPGLELVYPDDGGIDQLLGASGSV
jgi:uncharacterized protein